jgi:hypothetical protein
MLQQLEDELCVRTSASVNSRTVLTGDGDEERLGVGDAEAEELGDDEVVEVEGEIEAVGELDDDCFEVGVGLALSATPLFHTFLFPLLTQVNRLP